MISMTKEDRLVGPSESSEGPRDVQRRPLELQRAVVFDSRRQHAPIFIDVLVGPPLRREFRIERRHSTQFDSSMHSVSQKIPPEVF